MTPEVEITSIFKDIIKNNLRYCAVCLRTERERKLVEPISYKKCLILLPVQMPNHERVAICFLCENEARRAWQLFSAFSFAATINRWFSEMSSKLRYIKDMPMDLKRVTENMTFDKHTFTEFWKLLRSRSELMQTEVLRVSNHSIQDHDDDNSVDAPAPEPEQSQLLPDMLGNPDLEHIVIIDDDDDTQTDINTHTPTQNRPLIPNLVSMSTLLSVPSLENVAILPEQGLLMGRDANAPDNFILYPAHPSPDGSWYIPSLNAKLCNGSLMHTPTVLEVDNNINAQFENVKFLEINGRNYNMKLVDSDSNHSRIQNAHVNKPVESTPVQIEPPTDTVVVGPSSAQKTVGDGADNTHRTRVKKPVNQEADSATLTGQCLTMRKLRVSKHPVMSDRVDWEEKIPMDVISFMDATDPNAEQFLSAAAGTAAEHTNYPKKSRYKDEGAVIDLC